MATSTLATFCSTLVDEWVRDGVRHAVVAPGSRSTPLALAIAADPRMDLQLHHDERAAGFMALGIGAATGVPALVLTTSGTAAVELHPAVVEASLAGVPMVVCTSDRPPELHHIGAPQTVDQVHLYGAAVRWYAEPGVPDEHSRGSWRSLAARAVAEARAERGGVPGPVQLNLAFRDPLVGEPGPLPEGRAGGAPWHAVRAATVVDDAALDELADLCDSTRGVIVAGDASGSAQAVHALAEALGWPVLADPRADARIPARATVAAFDAIVRVPDFGRDHTPEVVLRLGGPPASKVLAEWLGASGARQVAVDGARRWLDPERTAEVVVAADPTALCTALAARVAGRVRTPWLARWARAEAVAQEALARAVAEEGPATEPALARRLLAEAPDGATVVLSSSMPVRDVEWYAAPRAGVRVLSNRGANGIDGVVSTAVGVAVASGAPTVCLVGDVAFLHDSTALLGAVGRAIDLTVVVVDNDGGGIFSFLPQADRVEEARFERLFGTPHGVDAEALARLHGVDVRPVEELGAAMAAGPGVRLVRAITSTDRTANVAVHERLNAAVHKAVLDVR